MTTTTMTSVQLAASQLLDALIDGKTVSLDLELHDGDAAAAAQLMTAVNDEARRRGVGVLIEPVGETRWCLSLRRD